MMKSIFVSVERRLKLDATFSAQAVVDQVQVLRRRELHHAESILAMTELTAQIAIVALQRLVASYQLRTRKAGEIHEYPCKPGIEDRQY